MIILFWKGCDYYDRYKNLLSQVSKFKDCEIAFQVQRQKDSSTIASQEAILLTQEEAIKLGLLRDAEKYGHIQSQVITKTKIVIDSVFIPYTPPNMTDTTGWAFWYRNGDTSKAIIDSLIANSIIVPATWDKSDRWVSVSGKVEKSGVLIDTIIIPNETSVTIGYKKTGFLKLGRKQVVDIQNTNPYLSTDAMKNVVIKPNKSLLNNKLFLIGVGLFGGLFLATKL